MKKRKNFITVSKKIGKKIVALAICASVTVGTFSSSKVVIAAQDEKEKVAEYYQKAEEASQEVFIDNFTSIYGGVLAKYKDMLSNGYGQINSLKGSFSKEIADSIDLSGLENVEIQTETTGKGDSGRVNYKLLLNDKQLLTAEEFLDGEKEKIYVRFPDVSKAFLTMDSSILYENSYPFSSAAYVQNMLNNNPFTEQILNNLLKKYAKIITEQLNHVTLKEDLEVNANGITGKVDEFTVTVTVTDYYKILKAVLEEASTDETLAILCEKAGFCTQKEYVSTIKTSLEELLEEENWYEEDLYEEEWDNLISMKVWVDSNGKIVGRKFFVVEEEDGSFGYLSMRDGIRVGFEAWSSDEDGDYFRMKTDGVKDANSNYTGKAMIYLTDSYEEKTESYTIDFKNANFNHLKDGYMDGTFTFTDNSSQNDSIKLGFVGSPYWQNIKCDVIQNKENMFNLEMDTKDVFFTGFNFPSETEEFYDIESEIEIESYRETMDKDFYKKIGERIENSELRARWNMLFEGAFIDE